MAHFIKYDYKQDTTLVINFEEQLQPGTFEHAIHYLIDNKLDLSNFHPKFKNKDTGRPAYDPAILLKIILFAYSKGITSSREIQWCCQTNIIFKALSCDAMPHFTTIAEFVSSRSEEVETLAQHYVREKVIPSKYIADALHIAIASIHNIPVLVSWNFEHIVKHKTRVEVNRINKSFKFPGIDICSPQEV